MGFVTGMTENTSQDAAAAKAQAIIIPVTPFQQNCTLLWCTETKSATVIDPGGDVLDILNAIKKNGVKVEHIWLTHGHVDHVGGAAQLRDELKAPITGPHMADKFLLDHVVESAMRFGMTGLRNVTPDQWLSEGDTVSVGKLSFKLLHCPGHSPGSMVFFNDAMRFAIMGDVLFNGSIGRTDLPGGDHDTLLASIRDKVLPLGDDVGFICGHGPGSNIGHERRTNPFLNGMA
jgi:glyoxylase-like metal-dependent hydrolase (beta-lactamase superfamily II)